MMKSHTISISIKKDLKTVYEFISNLENLPRWASSTFPSIKEINGEWLIDTPQGQNKVKLTERNNFGILDHYVELPSGVEVYIPLRVVKNNNGSEVMVTVFQTTEMTNEVYEKDLQTVNIDLNQLKTLIEEF
ncbi:SRPBCC family protein [Candidatus Nitrosocosmicus hydrocola]|uniref:SRPBCC family protein n=1 Tax=Candidatus Nitrosocosmicus hydrocola TaxID=1826872 RepID=UPI001372D96F|nr:SRPBCC family protein [Candidatus Nitrosocosmicus hydrocola]